VATEHEEPAQPNQKEEYSAAAEDTFCGASIIGTTLVMRGKLTLDEDRVRSTSGQPLM
jgi:hypothetical protein